MCCGGASVARPRRDERFARKAKREKEDLPSPVEEVEEVEEVERWEGRGFARRAAARGAREGYAEGGREGEGGGVERREEREERVGVEREENSCFAEERVEGGKDEVRLDSRFRSSLLFPFPIVDRRGWGLWFLWSLMERSGEWGWMVRRWEDGLRWWMVDATGWDGGSLDFCLLTMAL